MKLILAMSAAMIVLGTVAGVHVSSILADGGAGHAVGAQERQRPDVIKLSSASKLGAVTFSHTNHTTKDYNIAGTGPIACVECHHTAQPAAEVAKHPPLKTAWPLDRTSTLTAENYNDPKTPEIVGCTSCHARAGEKPKVWPEIPQIKHEGSPALISLNNQQAFHRNCAGCHDAAAKERAVKAPKTAQCVACHVKGS